MHIHSTATVYISHDVASTDSKAIFFAAFSLTCCHIYTAWTPYLAHFMVYMYLFHHSLTISIYLVCHFYPEEHQSSTSTPINHTKQKHVNQSILGYPVTTTCLWIASFSRYAWVSKWPWPTNSLWISSGEDSLFHTISQPCITQWNICAWGDACASTGISQSSEKLLHWTQIQATQTWALHAKVTQFYKERGRGVE